MEQIISILVVLLLFTAIFLGFCLPKKPSKDFKSNKIHKYPNAHRAYREQDELINRKNK